MCSLQRFEYDYNTRTRSKVNQRLEFPEILDVSPFISASNNEPAQTASFHKDDLGLEATTLSSTLASSAEPLEVEANHNPPLYELFAILVHSGTVFGGHYFAYIKDVRDDQWSKFNDSVVSSVDYAMIEKESFGGDSINTSAYMLMYRKRGMPKSFPLLVPLHAMGPTERNQTFVGFAAESKQSQSRDDQGYANTRRLTVFTHSPADHRLVTDSVLIEDATISVLEVKTIVLAQVRLSRYVQECVFFLQVFFLTKNVLSLTLQVTPEVGHVALDRTRLRRCLNKGPGVPLDDLAVFSSMEFSVYLEVLGDGESFSEYRPNDLKIRIVELSNGMFKDPVALDLDKYTEFSIHKETIRR